MNSQDKTKQQVLEEWQEKKLQERRHRKHTPREEGGSLNINSMMDAMTIILIFLLMNYSMDPMKTDYQDLTLPKSVTELDPSQSASLVITKTSIIVADQVILQVKDGMVDKTHKEGSNEASLKIVPLMEKLEEGVESQKELARKLGRKYEGLLTIIADETTPYRLLTEVMYTAGQSKYKKFKFAVVSGGQRG